MIIAPYTKVVMANYKGLGCRLRNWAACMRISEYFNVPLYLLWYKDSRCFANWNELFSNKFRFFNNESEVNPFEKCTLSIFLGYPGDIDPGLTSKYFEQIPGTSKRFWYNNVLNVSFNNMYDATPEPIKSRYIRYFSYLRPHRQVKKRIAPFEHLLGDDVIGVHFRQNDALKKRPLTYEDLIGELDKYPNNRFFIATDKHNVMSVLKDRYPSRVLYQSDNTYRRNNTRDIQCALADMLLLSKCPFIIGSRNSCFTEIAWWFSGGRAKIKVLPT